ncbi:hypothetical protein RGQ29_009309 [Quercus rubra]|uniref:RING-type E3 ubiquitin transferase n=1 Tax=Quercus rubra TaxID=3512 RepID=A0AAN7J5X7_QUERU|nr:hypothetical protein RGQ29_009309 [Quercus rubra]KAK4599201.1 hypothetical protein RGQ29_009309 [Quercus rubra]KAK4599202.1 hypothetical protein RGQ29_009309 [Quercus rubra]
MARNYRILFPTLTATSPSSNCYCDLACPYNCEPAFPDPDYSYFSPPPPPPSLTASHSSKFLSHHLSTFLIISLSVLVGLLVLISYYVLIVRSCPSWCSRRNNGRTSSQSDGTDEDFLDENHVDHPIWFITTVGLQQSIISSIAVCKYKKDEGLIEGTECSVCLNEFHEDEMLRLLPKCSHAFHIRCIDTWLRSHTNCPLCRANIITTMMNSGNDGDITENPAGITDESELLEVNGERTSKEAVNCSGNNDLQALGDDSMDNGIQVIRSISEGSLVIEIEDAENSQLNVVPKQDVSSSEVELE